MYRSWRPYSAGFQPAASLYLQVYGLCALAGARNKPATGSYRVVACDGSVQHSCNCKIDQINTFILNIRAALGLKYLVLNVASAFYRTVTTKISRCARVRLANAKSVFRVFSRNLLRRSYRVVAPGGRLVLFPVLK